MARITTQQPFASFSGRDSILAGNVLCTPKTGLYARTRALPQRTVSSAQQQVRDVTSLINAAWEALDAPTNQIWRDFARLRPWGASEWPIPEHISGKQAYQLANWIYAWWTQATTNDLPGLYTVEAMSAQPTLTWTPPDLTVVVYHSDVYMLSYLCVSPPGVTAARRAPAWTIQPVTVDPIGSFLNYTPPPPTSTYAISDLRYPLNVGQFIDVIIPTYVNDNLNPSASLWPIRRQRWNNIQIT